MTSGIFLRQNSFLSGCEGWQDVGHSGCSLLGGGLLTLPEDFLGEEHALGCEVAGVAGEQNVVARRDSPGEAHEHA